MFVDPNVYFVCTQTFGRRLSIIEALKISVLKFVEDEIVKIVF